MTDAINISHPAPGEVVLPSASPRPSPIQNPNSLPPYHPPSSGYGGPYGAPPPHMGSPNHHVPPPYSMYPHYPPMNGPPSNNYGPPPSAHQQQSSPADGSSGPPPPYNMYHMPYGYPPNWSGQGGPDNYAWGMPPPHHPGEMRGEYPSHDAREACVKDGEVVKEEVEREPGGGPESASKDDDHGMPPPSYYHPYPPYGMPPEEAPPNAPHFPPNYPGHQFGPPPPYGHPPPHQYPYSSDMNPYPYPMPGYPSPRRADSNKRPRPSPSENQYAPYPPPKRYVPDPHAQWAPKRSSSQFPGTKSVRRKKKMYSDYVGVTYNKTHAKYQACITHYRKQHYLGRYKLAVDAALAYDESARLLKGASWKVNFPTRQAYEEAKMRELESHGAMGGRAIDVDKSMATVVSKVEEIASKTGNSTAQNLVVRPRSRMSIDPTLPVAGPRFVVTTDGKSKHTPYYHQPQMAGDTPSMSKVTPSPSAVQGATPHEPQKPPAQEEDDTTPLPETPNPTRHVMGAEPNTPDSVIKPMALSYLKGGQQVPDSRELKVVAAATPAKMPAPRPPAATRQVSSTSKLPPITPKITTFKRDVVTSPRPVIQNGTLAAASALMTLFGENSPKGR